MWQTSLLGEEGQYNTPSFGFPLQGGNLELSQGAKTFEVAMKIFVGRGGRGGLQSGSAQNAILLKRRKICARRIYE